MGGRKGNAIALALIACSMPRRAPGLKKWFPRGLDDEQTPQAQAHVLHFFTPASRRQPRAKSAKSQELARVGVELVLPKHHLQPPYSSYVASLV